MLKNFSASKINDMYYKIIEKFMKNLINLSDLTKTDFLKILNHAEILEKNIDNCLENKNIGLIFEKNSTRTRLSFQVGINQLQGNFIDIDLNNLNLNRFESYEDTFEIMSCYLDCLVFRTTDHKKLGLAKKYFQKPIINALSIYPILVRLSQIFRHYSNTLGVLIILI